MKRILIPGDATTISSSKKQLAASNFTSTRDHLKKRSKKYLELIASLDHDILTTTKGMEALADAIKEEFGTAGLASIPLGIVAKCFLGHPYEVHTLDLSGNNIVHHYKIAEPLQAAFEKARAVACHDAYVLVEVYTDKIILIREDGSTSLL